MSDTVITPRQVGDIKQLAVADNGDGTYSLKLTTIAGDEVSTITLAQSTGTIPVTVTRNTGQSAWTLLVHQS